MFNFGYKSDEIIQVGIDNQKRLFITPKKEKFPLIYRSAAGVNWDSKKGFLHSNVPRDLSYLEWFKHIVSLIKSETKIDLKLTKNTKWINISDDLKNKIKQV